jgi:hypothetical protein
MRARSYLAPCEFTDSREVLVEFSRLDMTAAKMPRSFVTVRSMITLPSVALLLAWW